MADQFLIDRIAATEAEILLYEAAIAALLANPIESYTLDTGQTVQKVTRLDVTKLTADVDSLYNRRATLRARCFGTGVTRVVPAH